MPLVLSASRIRVSATAVACVIGLAAAQPAAAQSSLQIPLQFDFLNPGAKSLAIGGAFVGVADDATASFANPAGLTQLGKSEFSLETRLSRVKTPFLEKGRLSGTITNEFNDTIQGPVFGESTGSHFGPAYISFVYVHPSHRWVLAGYRHELARVDQRFFAEGIFQQDPQEFTSRRESPQDADREISITGYGGSGSYKVTRTLSLGAGLAVYRFSMDSLFRRFDTIGFLGEPDLTDEIGRSTQAGEDTGVAPTAGLLFERSRARIGLMYRHGPTFDYTTVAGTETFPQSHFRVPNTLAVGASFRWTPALLVAGEVTSIGYSRLTRDLVTDQAKNSNRSASFTIDDGTEVHLGAQYLAADVRFVPRIRVGWWLDPDHSVKYTPPGTSATATDRLFDERLSTALSQGESQSHFTLGAGFTFVRWLEVNVGTDLASTAKRFSVSVILK